jgi:hypothetical protein
MGAIDAWIDGLNDDRLAFSSRTQLFVAFVDEKERALRRSFSFWGLEKAG